MIKTRHVRFRIVLTLVCAIAGGNTIRGEESLSAEDVRDLAHSAFESIRTIECSFSCYRELKALPGAVLDNRGRVLTSEYRFAFDQAMGRELLDGRWGSEYEGRWVYNNCRMAFDGEVCQTFVPDNATGRVKRGAAERMFRLWRGPLAMIGKRFGDDPLRDLSAVLSSANTLSVSRTATGLLVLSASYDEEYHDEGTSWKEPYRVDVTIDEQHGFLPRRIERFHVNRGFINWVITADEFAKINNVWVPIRGTDAVYTTQAIYPNGMSEVEFERLPVSEQKRLASEITFRRVPLASFEADHFVIDPASVRVNEPIAKSRFQFEFPPGSTYLDERTEKLIQVPITPPSLVLTGRFWLAVLIVSALLIGAVIYLRRGGR